VLSLSVGLQDVQKAYKLDAFGLFSSMAPPKGGQEKAPQKLENLNLENRCFAMSLLSFSFLFLNTQQSF
jgi:hypothetical protein